jgi:hypothetical protein
MSVTSCESWAFSNTTAEDLKELGITTVGDRRLLLEAIAALRGPAGKAGADAANDGSKQSN